MITGERIRNIREDKDILQQELADAVGINVSVLSRIEKGTRQLRDDELVKIADKLNVSVDYLLGRTDEPGGTAGFQKRLLGDINGDSPLAQKAREAMATQEARNTNPELASITPAELALIHAYRNASSDIKRVVSSALQPRKVVAPDEQYRQIDEFFQLCNVNFYYARCDHNGMTEGDYIFMSKYPFPIVDGKVDLEDISAPAHSSSVLDLYEVLFPAMTTTGPEREKMLQDFINETFALDIAYENGTPYISENMTMGLPKEAAEKHFQKRIAELTAKQSAEEADKQPKPAKSKRA